MKLTFITVSYTCFFLLVLTAAAVAQGGSGDLPPVPKSTASTKAKPKPASTKAKTPTPTKTATKVVAFKEPATVEPVAFNQEVAGKIDAPTAGRIPPNVFFQEFALTATDADLFTIQLNSPAASLKVELLDATKINLPLKRDEHSGAYQLATPEAVLPADGEYRVRVSVAPSPTLTAPILYALKLNHLGLTAAGYKNRLEQIVKGFSPQKVEESIGQLERLAQDDAKQAGAYEYLGLLYNEFKKDQVKASAAMLQAIKLGGAAIFKIAHDSQWRKPSRDRQTQRLTFQELKTSWLRISATSLVLADFNTPDKPLATLSKAQVKEVTRVLPSSIIVVKHNNKLFKIENVSVGLSTPAEAEMVVDLIKGNLLGQQ